MMNDEDVNHETNNNTCSITKLLVMNNLLANFELW